MKPNTVSAAAMQRRNLASLSSPEVPALDVLRARRVLSRVAVSDALAREIGALAFAQVDHWGARA
ncbi:hypothetical protein [Methylobacterium variabile]|jgi:hypothetical protein|uniref:hypothetical protein n=1 Tax=Methylobacterium variabile TaxID=298794 RepID=UPI000B1788D5|nr:hypothetical protein [Methylobacterium variabile]